MPSPLGPDLHGPQSGPRRPSSRRTDDRLVRLRRRAVPIAGALLGLAVLGAPAAGAAGTASLDGTTARYADPSAADNDLGVRVSTVDPVVQDPEGIGGWRTTFYEGPGLPSAGAGATTPGAGCREGFVSVLCPTGAVPPGLVADLGGGNDQLRVDTDPAFPGQKGLIAGGAGNDTIRLYQTAADLDGGPGDDTFEVDRRFSINDFPPAVTPGGTFKGGDGIDLIDYTQALDDVDVSLDGKPNDGRKGEGDNVQPDIENVTGAGAGSTLIGSDRPNELIGRGGADRLVGGAGKDRLDGGGGDDTIDALDGSGGDRVTCGDGADVAFVDGGDVVTSENVMGGTPCEKVVYAPAPASSSLRRRAGRIAVLLSCPKTSTATCTGTLRLTSTAGKRIASSSYRVARGKKAAVRLRATKKPAAKAVLLVSPKGSTPTAGRAVTVR